MGSGAGPRGPARAAAAAGLLCASSSASGPAALPGTFEAVRRAEFGIADADEDGRLSHAGRASEWEAVFGACFELRLAWPGGADALQAHRWGPGDAVPKAARRNIRSGLMYFPDFLAASAHALQSAVDATRGRAGRLRTHALALLALHRWEEASAALSEGLQSGELPAEVLQEAFSQLWARGRHLEYSWLWRFLRRSGYARGEPSQLRAAAGLAEGLRREPARAGGLRPPPPSRAEAAYLRRAGAAAGCPSADATREAVEAALAASRPVVLRAAGLVPGVAAWAAQFARAAGEVEVFRASRDGVFYQTRRLTGEARPWGVRPARVPLRLGDVAAAAGLRGARLYLPQRSLVEMGEGFEALAPGAPEPARGLNLSRVNLWAAVGGGTVSLPHFDALENILAQVHGTKEFLLWPPEDIPRLEYGPLPQLHLNFSCCPARFTSRRDPGHVKWNQAAFDVRFPERHPGLRETRPLRCVLGPGDALVLPEYWTHLVVSYPGDAGACELCGGLANLAVNFWFLSHRPSGAALRERCAAMASRGDCARSATVAGSLCVAACRHAAPGGPAPSGAEL